MNVNAGQSAGEADTAASTSAPAVKPLPQRLVRAGVAVLLLVVVPAAVALVVAGGITVAGAAMGSAVGVLTCAVVGRRYALRLLPVTALAAFLGALTAGDWWWVLVVTALAAAAGLATAAGLGMPLVMTAIVAVVSPPQSAEDAARYAVFALLGGLYGWFLAGRLGMPSRLPRRLVDRPAAAVAAVAAAAAVGAGATIAVALGSDHAYWIPMTVLVLFMTTASAARERVRHRLVGTALGIVVIIPLLLVLPGSTLPRVAGLAALVLSLAVEAPYWLKTTLGTVAVVLLIAPSGDVAGVAERRLLFTVIGALLLCGGLLLLRVALPPSDRAEIEANLIEGGEQSPSSGG